MKRLLLVGLAIFSVNHAAAKYMFTKEDQECTAKAINDTELSGCFNEVWNKIDRIITKKLAGDKRKLAQYNKEAKNSSKKCDDKYRDEDGILPPYGMAQASQCAYVTLEKIGKKYGVRF
ncbi:MAG: hypothetical protein WDW20_06490 [Neisseriaceae bacterium]